MYEWSENERVPTAKRKIRGRFPGPLSPFDANQHETFFGGLKRVMSCVFKGSLVFDQSVCSSLSPLVPGAQPPRKLSIVANCSYRYGGSRRIKIP